MGTADQGGNSEVGETPPETEIRTPLAGTAGRFATFFIRLAAMVLFAVLAAGCSNNPQSTSPSSKPPTATAAVTPTSTSTTTSAATPTSGSPSASGSTTTAGDPGDINASSTTTALASSARTRTESAGSSASARPLVPYEEPNLGFSIAYPKGWRLTETAGVAHVVGGEPIKNVGFFDPTGNHDGVVLLEGVAVSVFKLRVVVNEELRTAFRHVVENQVSLLQAGLSQVEIIEGLDDSEIGGTQALETTFRFTAKGRRMRTRLVFFVSGGFEYQLTAQAADASYGVSRPRLDQVIGSFRLKD